MPQAAQPPSSDPKAHTQSQVVAFPRSLEEEKRPSHNMPLALTSFIGREREIAEVRRLLLLEDKDRLLTLTGPGGCGKTRLALAVASEVVEEFEDGVWWVELASLSDPNLVPQAVASVLGVREASGRSLTHMLAHHLKPKKTLLVLDNCEHLVESCTAFADALLHACPNLRILVTSREALGIAGERAWLVPSLSLPDSQNLPPLEGLANYEAIRLFVERAASAATTFELTERDAPAVARLCQRLDGIPLAIELAAARARVLSVEQIASRLDDCFSLLTGGSRMGLPRQRTLQATIEWSHDLLSEKERTLFRKLTVFAGGFTLEAAEAVCAGRDVEPEEVLDLLTYLVDKSMVLVAQQGGKARYRLLETVRQYGRQKLDESGEEPAVRRHHADFFLKLAEQVEPKINSKDHSLWLERLEAEHANLRAALAYYSQEKEAQGEAGLRLAGALFWFWFYRGHWSEGRGWLDGALAAHESAGMRPPARTAARAKVLCGAGLLAWVQGDQAAARFQLEETVTLWRELGDKKGLGQALRILSHQMLGQDDPTVARSLAEESVELFREGEDEFELGGSLATLGLVALTQEDYAAAESFLEESVAICRKTGNDWALALALRNQGIRAFRQGDYELAVAHLRESLAVLGEPGNPVYMINLELLAAAVSMQGEHGRAARLFGTADALREAVGASVLASVRADYDQGVAAARAGLGEAAFATAWSEGWAMSPKQAMEYALYEKEPGPSPPPKDDKAGLSAREVEVLRLVSQGLTDPQVAERLYLSPRTVGWYLRSIYRKLGVPSRAAAVKAAAERSLI